MVARRVRHSWHLDDPALFARVKEEVEAKYPTLHASIRDQVIFFEGSFPIADEEGVIDSFDVAIVLPIDFPRSLPRVFETGKRIPRTGERHMFTNGTACLFVEAEWWASHPDGCDLVEFLDGPVRNYFLGQSLVERGKPWPFGERSHGTKGVLETYADLTGTANLETAREFLRLLAKDKIKGHHKCPCGSGKLLRHCHQWMLVELQQKLPRRVVREAWEKVRNS